LTAPAGTCTLNLWLIAALRSNGDHDLAERLEDCVTSCGTVEVVGRTSADLLHVFGADDR
jgi:hypothetical protein